MVTDDRPKWSDLISLRWRTDDQPALRVIKWITSCEPTQCADLAHLLLQDELTVKKLKMNNTDNDQFVRAVLREWLDRDDDDDNDPAAPRTWAALAECIHDADLPGALAKAIRDATTLVQHSELMTGTYCDILHSTRHRSIRTTTTRTRPLTTPP